MAELDAIRSGLITHMYLDITGWTRTPEVVDYALARGITVDAAVGELVNSGLSHLLPPSRHDAIAFSETCCGKCSGPCYVDQMTGA